MIHKDQIFDDEIDHKCYVKKSAEISYQQHSKNFQGILLYCILENLAGYNNYKVKLEKTSTQIPETCLQVSSYLKKI